MSDYAALVTALYQRLGTWQAVATACGGLHSPGYYQQVAVGRIQKPSEETCRGIESGPECAERLLKRDFSNNARLGLAVRRSIGLRLRCVKIARGWTWDETLERAAALLEDATDGKLDERR